MDDFVYRIQFFRLLKRFMEACLVKDFKFEDLMTPGELFLPVLWTTRKFFSPSQTPREHVVT